MNDWTARGGCAMDNRRLACALTVAPIFVALELLVAIGFRPDLSTNPIRNLPLSTDGTGLELPPAATAPAQESNAQQVALPRQPYTIGASSIPLALQDTE